MAVEKPLEPQVLPAAVSVDVRKFTSPPVVTPVAKLEGGGLPLTPNPVRPKKFQCRSVTWAWQTKGARNSIAASHPVNLMV